MPKSLRLLAASAALSASLIIATNALAAGSAPYEPAPGEDVIINTHRFKPADFDAALKLVTEGFAAAMKASGQTRKTEFLVDRANYKVVVISFFGPGSDIDVWLKNPGRLAVMNKLAPMRSAPIEIERLKLGAVSWAP